MTDIDINQWCAMAQDRIDKGWDVYQKFTCHNCGARQTMDEPNIFYVRGTCEECGHTSPIEVAGMMIISHNSQPVYE